MRSLVLALMLVGCSTTTEQVYMDVYETVCVSPKTHTKFAYDKAMLAPRSGDLLTLITPERIVYYNIPEGGACRLELQPIQEENN